MVELVCLTALGVVSLFTGIVSLGNSDAFMGMFTFMILLVSYALIILTFRKRRTLFKAKEVIYTGYEIYLYILSYVIFIRLGYITRSLAAASYISSSSVSIM